MANKKFSQVRPIVTKDEDTSRFSREIAQAIREITDQLNVLEERISKLENP